MEQESGAQFEAEVAIGKGLRTIDRRGSASIEHGHLTLRNSKGDVVADAPVSEVWGDKARFSFGSAARVWIDGVAYAIGPLRVRLYAPGARAEMRRTWPGAFRGSRRAANSPTSSSSSWRP